MSDRTCARCGRLFAKPYYLRKHNENKRPCAPVSTTKYNCSLCPSTFLSQKSLERHRVSCTASTADSEELRAKVDHMTKLLSQLATDRIAVQKIDTFNNTTNNNIEVKFYKDTIKAMPITCEMISRIYNENPRLIEFSHWSTADQANWELAHSYARESLTALVREVYRRPENRNVRINPRRADQVIVTNETEEVLTLESATSDILGGVAVGISQLRYTDRYHRDIPLEARSSNDASLNLYQEKPELITKASYRDLAAILSNQQ